MTSILSQSTVKNSNNLAYPVTKRERSTDRVPSSVQGHRRKLIVDKDIGHTKMEGIHESICEALQHATSGTIIKIASDLYEEQLLITKPNLVLEPKEKGGEVTFQQNENPCIVVDVGEGNSCTINNVKMLLRGPNRDTSVRSFAVNNDFEQRGSEKCMKEFFAHKPEEMYCIVLLRSGTLKINGCTLSLE